MNKEEIDQAFLDLVQNTLTTGVDQAIQAGLVEVHIGFHEVQVTDASDYGCSLIRPYVHITQVHRD